MANVNTQNEAKLSNRMLEAPINKLIIKLSLPTMVSMLITSIYSLADTFFVSSLGTNATAAVSVNASLDSIIMMAGSMLAVGANSFIARLLGARKKDGADRVLSTCWFTAFFFGLGILIIGKIFIVPLVHLLGSTPTCETYAIQYATYILYAAPFMATSFVMNQCLRAEGSAMLSMIGMGFGGILNCFLDPIFIFRLGFGVAGASMATAISKLVSFIILIFPYISRRSVLHLSIRNVKYTKADVYQVVSVGSSSLFRTGFQIISAIVLNRLAGGISDSMLACIGVSNKIMMFPFGIILGFGQGFQPVSGYNWGARRFDRVKASYKFCAWVAIIGGVVMGLAIGIFAQPLIGLFSRADTELIRLGTLCIRMQCIVMPIHAWVMVVNMFCGSLGYARGSIILGMARQGICFLPIVFPLAILLGDKGLCSAQAMADVLSLVLAIPLYIAVSNLIKRTELEYVQQQANPLSEV